jgi:hypothetical protein
MSRVQDSPKARKASTTFKSDYLANVESKQRIGRTAVVYFEKMCRNNRERRR